ncbi:MAG TPA: ABC transporter substrate-binding protein [Candidatus Binatia bacterium]|nr:ABC transporter substrate-binding protein [Candidatus Binatia bacterium]
MDRALSLFGSTALPSKREGRSGSSPLPGVLGLLLGILCLFCVTETARAQKVYSIGSLNTADQFISAFDGFRSRMAELGYREAQNVRYQYYNSRGNAELLRTLAEKLAQDRLDLIVTSSTSATVAAAKATQGSRVPVVFLSAGNAQMLVKSFSSSGTNLAGISSASVELVGKRLELLKELAPGAKRVAMPLDPTGVNYNATISEASEAAARLGLKIWQIKVTNHEELERLSQNITRKTADAVFAPPDSLMTDGIEILVAQAIKQKLPLVTSLLANVKRGCLATYAADYNALGRQGAVLADKILKGARPGDLPIELPDKFKLALNLKTAQAIDLKIPKEILLRADQILE